MITSGMPSKPAGSPLVWRFTLKLLLYTIYEDASSLCHLFIYDTKWGHSARWVYTGLHIMADSWKWNSMTLATINSNSRKKNTAHSDWYSWPPHQTHHLSSCYLSPLTHLNHRQCYTPPAPPVVLRWTSATISQSTKSLWKQVMLNPKVLSIKIFAVDTNFVAISSISPKRAP